MPAQFQKPNDPWGCCRRGKRRAALAIVAFLAMAGGNLQAPKPETPGGLVKATRPPQAAPIRTVAFSPDGKSLAVGGGPKEGAGQVTLWDIAARTPVWQASLPRGAYSLAFAPDGKTLAVSFLRPDVRLLDAASGSRDGEVKLWDAASQRVVATLGQ
jgi:WD40 repeat protein